MGHQWVYKKTKAEKLKEELKAERESRARERASNDQYEARLRDERDSYKNKARAQKAAKTRLKNRVAAGVCPCCNRTFQNLARHMDHQHPDFKSES